MRKILKNLLSIFIILSIGSQFLIFNTHANTYPNTDPNGYTVLRSVDKNSFNEYRYLIAKELFKIKNKWKVDGVLDSISLNKLKSLALTCYNFLPDNNLRNDNLLNNLNISISKSLKNPNSDAAYIGLIKSIGAYLEDSSIGAITGKVSGLPKSGNAPFNVTLRASVSDPTGTTIPKFNYVWWMNEGSKKVNIGTGPSINYTFREHQNYKVFVDIKSAHKNSKGYTDVIPYRGQVEIEVKEKIASLIVKVNGDRLGTKDRLKFTPTQAKYGLLFDATSSIPTLATRFIKTEWDFGNGVKRSYDGDPKVERVKYIREGDFTVKLKLKTNLGRIIERKFVVSIHDPIATIDVSPKEGFLGDKFTFRAKNTSSDEDLTYNWQIIDIINDEIVFSEQTKLFTYNFKNKGHFNVKLEVNGIDSSDRNIDTKNIYINSRAPVADFTYSIPETNQPNRILLDATDSFDPDFVDTGKLKYSWEINGSRVELEEPNDNGSLGYYTFSNIGDHNVVLRVEDPDSIEGTKKDKVTVNSILSLDFSTNPRAIKRGNTIRFEATSPEAQFFEWDFGDGNRSTGGVEEIITHKYEKTGIFDVKLKVIDKSGKSNTHNKVVYVGDGENPVAILNVGNNTNNTIIEKNACKGQDAYIADRITSVVFDAGDSIDIDGNTNNLDYSLKIGSNKYFTSRNTSYRFDELGCFPIILKVTSKKNRSSDTKKVWIKVKNIEPSLSKLVAKTDSLDTDPVVVTVDAVGALDKDGVITSYLWYYYTDLDEEPQDFRSTVGPSTKFVLPKITGNYYFVVLLTDDSNARISSKDLGKSSSLTLAGNNINVPILELKTPDNSVHVGDEVIFNAKVQNILKQNISKKVEYFWDFDGDGFYDAENKKPSITHIYEKPGTFYAKLKVKHKGFSNSRNVEINVANSLAPHFEYVSIGNKYIFINKTTGTYENFSFDLGDGTKVEDRNYFIHTYKDNKSSHNVTLIVSDGNTIKKYEKKVVKDIKNLLKSKKSTAGILIMNPSEDEEKNIVIDKRVSNITAFFVQDDSDFSEIGADIDSDKDTDLNGGKDDDNDVISVSDKYLNIDLNTNKEQKIRVFVRDSDGKVVVSNDYKIIKTYIKDEDIDLDKVLFDGVTPEQKQKLEDLKDLVSSIGGDDGRAAKTYVARLKDEWNDVNERTKVIYEFEGFLDSSFIQNKNEIVEKLEELLLKENDDNSLKSVALRALQGLTPENVECEFDQDEYKSCKQYIDTTLEIIKSNDDIEQNRLLGKSILEIIGADENLSTDQKLSYKATLQNLIYGDVSSIPKDEISQELEEDEPSIIVSILKIVLYIVLAIMGLFVFGGLLYFLYYKFSNKKTDKGFQDFVEEKTSSKDDVFSEKLDDKVEESIKLKPKEKNDIFSSSESSPVSSAKIISKNNSINSSKTYESDVPAWLKVSNDNLESNGTKNNSSKTKSTIVNSKNISKSKNDISDGLKGGLGESRSKKEVNSTGDTPDWLKNGLDKTPKKEEIKKIEKLKKDSKSESMLNSDNKKQDSSKVKDDVPDWLKGGLGESKSKKEVNSAGDIPDWLNSGLDETPKKEEIKKIEKLKKDSKSESILNSDNKKQDSSKVKDDVPDWLKGGLGESKSKKEVNSAGDIPDWLNSGLDETPKKEEPNKTPKASNPKGTKKQSNLEKTSTVKEKSSSEDNSKNIKKPVTEKPITSKIDTKNNTDKKVDHTKQEKQKEESSDLWDDGMDVPDWLKS